MLDGNIARGSDSHALLENLEPRLLLSGDVSGGSVSADDLSVLSYQSINGAVAVTASDSSDQPQREGVDLDELFVQRDEGVSSVTIASACPAKKTKSYWITLEAGEVLNFGVSPVAAEGIEAFFPIFGNYHWAGPSIHSTVISVNLYRENGSLVSAHLTNANRPGIKDFVSPDGGVFQIEVAVSCDYLLTATKGSALEGASNTDITISGKAINTLKRKTLIIDPGHFAKGTVLTHAAPGVMLSTVGEGEYEVKAFHQVATDLGMSGFGWGEAGVWSDGSTKFRADFSAPVSGVSLDFIANDTVDKGYLSAYAADGTCLETVTTQWLGKNQKETLRVTSENGEIAYIIASGFHDDSASGATQSVCLTRLVVESEDLAGDFYEVKVNEGDDLAVNLKTPTGSDFDGTAQAVLELYDPQGNLVAVGTAADGENVYAELGHSADVTGVYTIRVRCAGQEGARYVLEAQDYTGSAEETHVLLSDVDGKAFRYYPNQLRIGFSDLVDASTVQPGDFLVNGHPASELLSGGSLVCFGSYDFSEEGVYTISVAEGAILDIHGNPVSAYTGQFVIDRTGGQIVSCSVWDGKVMPAGKLAVSIQFSETLDESTVLSDAIALYGDYTERFYQPVATSYDPVTSTLTATYQNLPEQKYGLALQSHKAFTVVNPQDEPTPYDSAYYHSWQEGSYTFCGGSHDGEGSVDISDLNTLIDIWGWGTVTLEYFENVRDVRNVSDEDGYLSYWLDKENDSGSEAQSTDSTQSNSNETHYPASFVDFAGNPIIGEIAPGTQEWNLRQDGREGGFFVTSFILDSGDAAIALETDQVVGQPESVRVGSISGIIKSTKDVNRYMLNVPVGGFFSVNVNSSPGLKARVQLMHGNEVVASATARGGRKPLELKAAADYDDGEYVIVVSSARGTGTFAMDVVTNADLEAELLTGKRNERHNRGQKLDSLFASLGGSSEVARVLGQVNLEEDTDWYRVKLTTGQILSVRLDSISGAPNVDVFTARGKDMPSYGPYRGNREDFKAEKNGYYLIRVSGEGAYALTVGKDVRLATTSLDDGYLGVPVDVSETRAAVWQNIPSSIDEFDVQLRQGEQVRICLDDLTGRISSGQQISIKLYDRQGNLLQVADSSDVSEDGSIVLNCSASVAGEYRIELSGGSEGHEYLLKVSDPARDVTLSGRLWCDLNRNRIVDGGEKGLEGQVVFIDKNRNRVRDWNEQSTRVDADGRYTFSGLRAGRYTVRTAGSKEWQWTTRKKGNWVVRANAGEQLTGLDMGGRRQLKFGRKNDAVLRDADGDQVVVSLKGPGRGVVFCSPDGLADMSSIVLGGTNAKSELIVSANGKNASTTIGSIIVKGSIGAITAGSATLTGSGIEIKGGQGVSSIVLAGLDAGADITALGRANRQGTRITVGDVGKGSDMVFASSITSLSLNDWLGGMLKAQSVQRVLASGDLQADIESASDLGTLTVGGELGGSIKAWQVGEIHADGNLAANIDVLGTIGRLAVKGNCAGSISAQSIGIVDILGDLYENAITLSKL